jgi:hypothetical protein
MTLEFNTTIKNVDLLGENESAISSNDNTNPIEVNEVKVKWQLELINTPNGIVDASITVLDYSYTLFQDDDYFDGENVQGFEIEVTKQNSGLTLECSIDDFEVTSMLLTTCTIDFNDFTIHFG